MTARDIIIRPVITEKSMTGVASGNKYTFKVAKKATKIDIAKAVEEISKRKRPPAQTGQDTGLYTLLEKGLCNTC